MLLNQPMVTRFIYTTFTQHLGHTKKFIIQYFKGIKNH